MRKPILLMFTVLVLPLSGQAQGAECSASARIDEGNRKYSVEVPKGSGMEAQSFDDIGCAVESRNNECATRQGMFDNGALVRDYATGEPVAAEKAFFVIKTGIPTPHGSGIITFKDKIEAEKFSAGHGKGKVLRWFELIDEKLN